MAAASLAAEPSAAPASAVEHWAFQPLRRPELPPVPSGWARNPIDRFIAARMQPAGLSPAPEADRQALVRRVTYDLTGLPPTPSEVETFLADPRPDAYERLVERLLNSPRFGEHQAQFWLDLARFAETDGFEHDLRRENAWQYRDWVIDAFNRDMPYDQFVAWQLAGDELAANDQAARTATAFCLSGPDMPDINSQDERRHELLNEMTATVGATFLALQVGCAQCHDHKYDPISQEEFYRLRAIFEPAVHVERNKSVSVLREQSGEPQPSYLMIRGDWRRPGREVQPGVPQVLNRQDVRLPSWAPGSASSGRRRALAQWLTQPNHPLTSRVIMNRLWQQHFGHGLSRTPSDFGSAGEPPTHPELLDWLACELVARGWSLKQMHRLMVTSATYRQATADGSLRGESVDAENRLLSHYPRRRVPAEALRDAMLAVAGVLNLEQGGPGVMPPLPEEMVATLLKNQWNASDDVNDHYRRSVFVFARRNLRYPIFEAFDRPDANASCARRSRSTTAPQALLMLNSRFSLQVAQLLAGRVQRDSQRKQDQVERAFQTVLSRRPSQDELREGLQFLEEQAVRLQLAGRVPEDLALPRGAETTSDPYSAAALTDLCLALLNCSEMLYLD